MGKLLNFSHVDPTPAPAPVASSTPSAIPAPTPAAPMPDSDSPLAKEAERRRAAAILQRGGRASTILSDSIDGGSSSDYSRSKLG